MKGLYIIMQEKYIIDYIYMASGMTFYFHIQ